LLAAAACAALTLGCSFSDSSKSISDSISGSSNSFSDSSTSSSGDDDQGSAKEALYREDVRDFTAAHVRDGGDVAGLQRGLSRIARQHGMNDWEAVDATWTGIGQGLKRADASPQKIDETSAALTADPGRRREIERGFAGQA
jgi:hypothetical protein